MVGANPVFVSDYDLNRPVGLWAEAIYTFKYFLKWILGAF